MRKLIVVNVAIILAVLMNSCATSNDVVSNRLISKRKYTKGLFVKKNLKLKSDGVEESENYAMSAKETQKETKTESANLNLSVRETQGISSDVASNQHIVSSDNVDINLVEDRNNAPYSVQTNTAQSNSESFSSEVTTKERKQELKQQLKANKKLDDSDILMLVLLIILAIILPPVAVAIYRGIDNIFWLDLILFLIGFGGFWFLPIAGIAALAAVIIAFLVIFDVI